MEISARFGTALTLGALSALLSITCPSTSIARESDSASPVMFEIDAVHSAVVFRISHMGVSNAYGMFHGPTGSYTLNWSDPSASKLEVQIATDKVDTGNEKRDAHLMGPDFFNSKQFPSISFTAKTFEKTGDNTMRVLGSLTMLDKTNPVEVELFKIGEGDTRQGYKSGFEARFTIKRSEFGMTKYLEGGALGDEVTLTVSVEGAKK